ncbi:maternal embryonic leucine zipper kinase isoform X2 [Diachasma alloeum]|uniref:maternal embryonic leucine zipper kinase isoform X2 n=1 Tax=Diachasma alloeum TaxID=454923 RepID=UPI0007383CE6|nr:maternal embryonic leucine zipper kinase isoform X2 [Diachasma alloeum]
MVRYAVLKGLYELDKTIGCGGFAKVKLATHIATGEKDDLPRVKLEVDALKTLVHQHICRLYQTIETESHYFMVMEYCSGGELFDHIVEKNRLSETESRKFFRQIVSAVAYLHSLGFAHRDLKPENILLDKDQNLKLIDFGLCAKPKGGMQAHLYTSCGSPTYAAPELIVGKKYLGSEVDIWSMGVLLYALLCGFLPFDDNSIESLYRKILSGKYDEPSWLSNGSRRLIRAMLQIDPKKRITIEELCSHPWVTAGFLTPVTVVKKTNLERNDEVLNTMSAICAESAGDVWKALSKSTRTDYTTATYLLLLDRKLRGLSLRISSASRPHFRRQPDGEYLGAQMVPSLNNFITQLDQSPSNKEPRKSPNNGKTYNVLSQTPESEKDPLKSFMEPPAPGRKRLRSREEDDSSSPVPVKRAGDHKGAVTPSTPVPSNSKEIQSTPGSAKKVIMGLERGLNKMRCVLTPKRRIKNEENNNPDQPIVLSGKGLCNISSTSSDSPEYVLQQLRRALQRKGIFCRQKGFTLIGGTESDDTENVKDVAAVAVRPFASRKACRFQLEVCLLEGVCDGKLLVGIRRKRLKGDAWVYKRVCEQVLALAAEHPPSNSNEQTNSNCLI